jgi:hypothetical protein
MTDPTRVVQRGLIGSLRGLTPVAASPTECRRPPSYHAHSYPNSPATSASFHVERRVS